MKLFSKIALATATVSIASFASAANSISSSTDFRVTLPEILVLYHWDDAHLILENNANNSAINDASTRDVTLPFAATHELNTDVVTTSTTKIDDGTIAVKLKNAWAVRSLSSGTVQLELTNPKKTLYSATNAALGGETGNSIITIGSPTLNTVATSVEGTNTATTTLKIKSGWEPVMGDIDFTLDLTKANHAGEYNTRAVAGKNTNSEDDTFLLTLTGN